MVLWADADMVSGSKLSAGAGVEVCPVQRRTAQSHVAEEDGKVDESELRPADDSEAEPTGSMAGLHASLQLVQRK